MPGTDNLFAGRYQLYKQIGRGGTSAVFSALDTETDTRVAVKVLSTRPVTSEQYRGRFRQEARALSQLLHRNIARVLDYGEVGGRPYLVVDWVGGGSLANKLGKPLAYRDAASLLLPAARALQYAHDRGIIHRNLKPSNILLSENGEPVLTDFGIAKMAVPPDISPTSVSGGDYTAPEEGLGLAVDQRVDVYSLGAILYELITGQKPYAAENITPAAPKAPGALKPARELVPDLPEDVDRVLARLLSGDPARRYQSMAEVTGALEKLAAGEKLSFKAAPTPAKPKPAPRPPRERPPRPAFKLKIPTVSRRTAVVMGVVFLAAAAVLLAVKFNVFASPSKTIATLDSLQGDVQLTSGGLTAAARPGALLASSLPALIKTNSGGAHLWLPDGSLVMLASQTKVEFTAANGTPQAVSPAFNLLAGKVLVANLQATQTSFTALLSGKITVSGIGAIMGLDVQPENGDPQDIDC
ncbi:MAG TPA: protein kinase, partial [Anaerolineaceae bacterium]